MAICRRCAETEEDVVRQKYCGDGTDKDFQHDWVNWISPEDLMNARVYRMKRDERERLKHSYEQQLRLENTLMYELLKRASHSIAKFERGKQVETEDLQLLQEMIEFIEKQI